MIQEEILLDDGMCEFNKHDTANSNALYSGIYVGGDDIAAGNMYVFCWFLLVLIKSVMNTHTTILRQSMKIDCRILFGKQCVSAL